MYWAYELIWPFIPNIRFHSGGFYTRRSSHRPVVPGPCDEINLFIIPRGFACGCHLQVDQFEDACLHLDGNRWEWTRRNSNDLPNGSRKWACHHNNGTSVQAQQSKLGKNKSCDEWQRFHGACGLLERIPQAALHICLFHTMQSFRREVTTEKLSIRPGERDHVLELITKLTYAKSESEYDSLYQDLLQTRLSTVIDYYNTNWHSIRHEWVECFKGVNFTLGKTTNNRLENINGKIKTVCARYLCTCQKLYVVLHNIEVNV